MIRLFIHTGFVIALLTAAANGGDASISFNRDVRPILSDTCFFCHGPDAAHREADLRLDVEAAAKEYAIVSGNAGESELIQRIRSHDPDEQMPPPDSGKSLTPEQIELLTRWVDQGAVYQQHWAYVPPKRVPIAQISDPEWPLDSIDRYVLSTLDAQGMQPSTPADRATLIRRVTFDLTGVPPTPDQLDEALLHTDPDSFQLYVDRLLASPVYGERMAAYWLDLVRFADTVGYHGDQEHNISPYRDYVINAFNDDLAFDQFTREQLAGDLLTNPTQDQLIATGYNRMLQTSHEGGVQPPEYTAIYAADRVRNVSAVWMGATVGCAQCHDHKYDPYTAEDFYSLSAFFADIDEAEHFKIGTNSLPTKRPPEISVLEHWQRPLLADIEQRLAEIGEESNDERARLQFEADRINDSARLTMVTKSIQPREVRVLSRGDWLDDSGPIVEPAVPAFLPPINVDARADRLDLANWLVDSERGIGGLTARVLVNRIWFLLFGRGLSASLADFGGQGEPPSHPELLDALTLDFIQSGWSVKSLVRRIVLSQAYRQSSVADPAAMTIDPYNRWFARQSRYRMPAEMVRDNALSLSGLMVQRVGGPSVRPYQPPGYYRHLNFPTRVYQPDQGSDQWRRGVYIHWQRQYLHPMMKAFDAPTREECTAQRPRSNTPLEALVLLNDPTMVESAIAMADRVLELELSDRERIDTAFAWATARTPDERQQTSLNSLLASQREYYGEHFDAAADLLRSTMFRETANSVELAAWTSVTRAILNMHETVTRN